MRSMAMEKGKVKGDSSGNFRPHRRRDWIKCLAFTDV